MTKQDREDLKWWKDVCKSCLIEFFGFSKRKASIAVNSWVKEILNVTDGAVWTILHEEPLYACFFLGRQRALIDEELKVYKDFSHRVWDRYLELKEMYI